MMFFNALVFFRESHKIIPTSQSVMLLLYDGRPQIHLSNRTENNRMQLYFLIFQILFILPHINTFSFEKCTKISYNLIIKKLKIKKEQALHENIYK